MRFLLTVQERTVVFLLPHKRVQQTRSRTTSRRLGRKLPHVRAAQWTGDRIALTHYSVKSTVCYVSIVNDRPNEFPHPRGASNYHMILILSPVTQVRTMKANYTIEAGDVRVIRPLVYVRERSTRDFSQEVRLPVINENCPACFEEPKVRSIGSGPAVVSL